MKKKIINLSLIGILLISLLSGCGKSEDKEEAKSTEPDIMQIRSICKLATVECYYHNVAKSEKSAGTGIWEKRTGNSGLNIPERSNLVLICRKCR